MLKKSEISKYYFLAVVFCLLNFSLFSQQGKDGAGNITGANTILNLYTPLTASANAGATTISVGSTAGINVGDLIMIIQMQGAGVNAQKQVWWIDSTMGLPADTSMGYIMNYNSAGNHEFAEVNSVLSATSLSLDCAVQKNYSSTGKTQIIRVPRYTTLSISGGGFITCPAWNGSTGGVAIVEVQTNATLSSVPSFNVTGKGFRGGAVENASTLSGANKYASIKPAEGAYKGESIAGDTTIYKSFSGVFCRGAIANGGGGATAHNAGGGGGANGGSVAAYRAYGNPAPGYATAWNLEFAGFATFTSSGGGRGGYTFSSSNQNPNTFGPGSGGWSGDGRRNMGGFGGRPLDYTSGRIFIGGGGGAGDSNDNYGTPAGNGGGLVYILCYGNVSGAGTIVADGGNGGNTIMSGSCSGRDGAGGGGGGGTIILNVVGSTALSAAPALFARGGTGGTQNFGAPCLNTEAYGPGAGGGGGHVGYTGALPANNVTGGANGIVSGNSGLIKTNFPPNGATMGGAGGTLAFTPANTITATPAVTICVNNSATLNASTNASPATILWYNASAGGSPIGTGSPYTTPVYTTPGTYTLWAGYCLGGIYRVPSVITVITGPTLTVNNPTICTGQSATLTASGATTYTWNTSATTSSINVNPLATTIYTVVGALGTCTASNTSTVTVLSAPVINVNSATVCAAQSATLTATGATSYTWSTGAFTSSISVTPGSTTVYTVTGSNGGCSATQTSTVTVSSSPTVSANSATVCAGSTATLTAAGATTYTWNTGATTAAITVTPATTTVYTVTGSNGTCLNTFTTSVTVAPALGLTVNSPSICSGQTATLTANGATTYTWNTSATTSSITVNPVSTTVYTVVGSTGSCTGTVTSTVTILSAPVVNVNSATICASQNATLSASGATSYTWNTGAFTSSISVNPATTTVYTVTGSNGSCSSIQTSTVTVASTPTVSANSATVCPGQAATLTAVGATTYTWNTGAVTSAITVTPAVNTNYTVTGSNGTCINTFTTSVTIAPALGVTVNSPSICAGQTATITANGATTYTWNTAATTSSITINPVSTTVYTVIGSSGSCTGTATSTVTVLSVPIVNVNSATVCAAQSATLTATGATSYTWSTGAFTSSISVTPGSTTVYTVTGSNGGCSATQTSTVTVSSSPTVSANSATVCAGSTATLTAAGATTYTWNTGATTAAITVTPATTTVYTVTGSNGTCLNTFTTSVTVSPALGLTVNSPSICSGQTATLTANGATTYTWNTSATTSSITVNPVSTTVYTVVGSTGSCTGTVTSTVNVGAMPVLNVNSATICSSQSATLSASGATSYTWNTSALTSSIIVNPTTTTVYTVTGDNGGCTSNITATVMVNSTPTVSANSATICPGQSATLTAAGATSYTWNTGATTSAITVTPATSTNFTVTGANGNCINIFTTSIVVVPNLVVSFNSATICAGQSATLNASGASTYTWNTSQTTQSIVVSPLVSTTYTVSGGSGACMGTGTGTVTINPLPIINTVASSANICTGQSATITANGAATYSWSPGSLNGNSINVSPSANTIYTVTGIDANGCSSTSTIALNVTTTPTVSLLSQTICAGQTATLSANGAATYTWLPSGLTGATFTDNPVSNTTYTLVGSNGSCSSITTATITIGSSLSISVNQPTICAGQSATLTATSSATTYTWSTGATTSSVTVTPPTSTTYTVTGNSGGCIGTVTTAVTVNNLPSISVNGVLPLCSGQTTTLTASGASGFVWEPGTIISTSIVANPTVTTNYTLTGTDITGCSSSSIITIPVSSLSTISLSISNASICAGETVTLTANSSATNYTWYPGSGVGSTQVVSPTSTQQYTVIGVNGACAGSALATVTVIPAPSITITPSSTPLVCSGSSVALVATGATNYTWVPGGITGSSILVSPSSTTTYTVMSGAGACTATAVQEVTVSAGISLVVSPGNILMCRGTRTTVTVSGAQNYLWQPGNMVGGTITVNPNQTTTYTVTGSVGSCFATRTVQVKVSSVTADFSYSGQEDNFSTVDFQNLSINANMHHWYFSNGYDTYALNPGVYFGDPGTYVACLYVKNYNGCSDTLCKAITVGCAENAVFIPNTFTPNNDGLNDVFRVVSLPQCVTKFNIAIFNGWGQKIYESDKIEEGWNGQFKGQPAEDNVYSYILSYTMDSGKAFRRTGHITLIK